MFTPSTNGQFELKKAYDIMVAKHGELQMQTAVAENIRGRPYHTRQDGGSEYRCWVDGLFLVPDKGVAGYVIFRDTVLNVRDMSKSHFLRF